MASHKSAEKRARQTERRSTANTARRSRVRGSIKKVEDAIKGGDKKAAAADPKSFVDMSLVRELEASGFIKQLYKR